MSNSQGATLADISGKPEPFIDRIPDYALFLLDTDGHVMSWNAGAERLKGYSAHEIIGQHFSVLYTDEDRATDKPMRSLDTASREGSYQEESWRMRKNGTRFWASVTITALKDAEGNLEGFAKLVRDFTERKINESRLLRAREARYRALYEYCHDAILLTRLEDGVVLAANPAACKLFGYPEEKLLSMRREQLLDMDDPRVSTAWRRRADTGTGTAELTFIGNDGRRFEAWATSKAFIDENGLQVACTSIYDITEKKQAEDALRKNEERFRLLHENAPIGIAHFDLRGYCTFANRKLAEIVGYPPGEVVGLSYLDVTLPDERDASAELMTKLLSGEIETSNRERRVFRKDGSTIWVNQTARVLRDKSGEPECGIAIFEDITERKQAEDALRQSEEKFRATFEHAPIGIAEYTVDGALIAANSKLVDILGYTKDELALQAIADLTLPDELEKSLANLRRLATGEVNSYVMEKRYIRKDRSLVWVHLTVSRASVQGTPQHIIVLVEDISARKKAEEDLKRAIESSYHQATHDMLTGLVNRASLQDRLQDALSHAQRDGDMVAIHLLDLDRFKSINDTLGHHVGDLLLKAVAERIKSHVRSTDVAARLGGDEFMIIQTHLAKPSAAAVLAAKLVEDLGRKYILEDQEVLSAASVGIATYPDGSNNPEELIKQADRALYDAKNRGRGNFQFYRAELELAYLETQQMEQDLLAALRHNQFCLHYQPQFDLETGSIAGIDALLRWRHPTRGLLAAGEFIHYAEHARLMLPIGEWILQTACGQYKAWVDAGLGVPLTLNMSSMQLRDPGLLQTLRRILEENGLPASSLRLEMRESVLWDPKLSKNLLSQMKESGLQLALDDFGTEMASLSMLDKFPFDAVKLGKDLVKELPSHKREAAILAAIVGVAHNLNLAVCAHGVETASQFSAVKEQGCDSAQGYLLSSPLDSDEMTRLVDVELAH